MSGAEYVTARPHPALRGWVRGYAGYREHSATAVRRRETPNASCPLIIGFGPTIRSAPTDRPSPRPGPGRRPDREAERVPETSRPISRPTPLPLLRSICLALPEVTERVSHGSPSWFVGKMFATFPGHHHGDQRLALWCAAPPGVQAELVAEDPRRFFCPPYVGGRGWLGVNLSTDLTIDPDPDPDELREILLDAYRTVAPARLR